MTLFAFITGAFCGAMALLLAELFAASRLIMEGAMDAPRTRDFITTEVVN